MYQPFERIKVIHTNVCGWTESNNELRCALLLSLNADIISVNETHLLGNNILELPNYVWFGNNRLGIHVRAPKGSGGVGIFVHTKLLDCFDVQIIDKSQDQTCAPAVFLRNLHGLQG